MLEEELLALEEMANKIHEYLKTHIDVPDNIAIKECPELYKACLFNSFGEEEKAEFILKRVTEKSEEERNGKRNGR